MTQKKNDRPFRLSTVYVKGLTEPGRYSDGPGAYGLSLLVRRTAWGGLTKNFHQRVGGRNIAVGNFPLVTLQEARDQAFLNARNAHMGRDPVVEIRKQETITAYVPAFADLAEQVFEANAGIWHAKTLHDTRSRFEMYVFPALGDKRVDAIRTADLIDVLLPYWAMKNMTMKKLANSMRSIFSFAIAQGYRFDNPADSKVLTSALPEVAKAEKHHEALPADQLADALARVASSSAWEPVRLAIEWTALTVARSGETRGATWAEITDSEWQVPASRMKAGKAHRVPISSGMRDVLLRASRHRDESGLLFPSSKGGEIHGSTIGRAAKAGGIPVIHGMRSSFSDYCAEQGIDTIISELSLSHLVGSEVFRAYMRSDLVERRRAVMQQWSDALVGADAFEV